jgi:hypothetical protein
VKTGKARWVHEWAEPGNGGILTTAGKLLFTGVGRYLVALDPADGRTMWHYELKAGLNNGPITFELDGKQFVVVGAGTTLYSFTVNPAGTTTATEPAAELLPPGAGREAVVRMCSGCHGIETAVATRRARADWENVVETMRGNGAPGTDSDARAVLDYLQTHFGR